MHLVAIDSVISNFRPFKDRAALPLWINTYNLNNQIRSVELIQAVLFKIIEKSHVLKVAKITKLKFAKMMFINILKRLSTGYLY